MLNRIVLIGRLTKDPELRYTPNGVAVTSFTLAVDRTYKNAQGEKETDFIPCVVFRQLAELCANYLAKGKLAAIEGRLQIRSFEGQDGQRRWATEVVGDNVRFLSPKDSSNDSSNAGSSTGSDSFSSFAHEISLDDDIPF
ncbi:MAG: single-stranded DNA-binding protein [Gracilibacter sp. BRH_c7a]|nr:MAG: single-stranded DNA-binding protein [Gracilibacter sp. BRH_c7a]